MDNLCSMLRTARRVACILGAALGVVLTSTYCGGSGGEPTAPPTLVATTIAISTPSTTVLAAGATLQLAATVRDQNGAAMTGQTIVWNSSDQTRATVSSTGLVTGALAGAASVTATSGALASNAVILTITAGAASALVKQHDVTAGIVAGATDSISVRVVDIGTNPVPNVTVTFAVTSGGGSLSTTTVQSGSDGGASVRWTTGTSAGAQTSTASASPLSGSPVLFSTTSIAGVATQIAITAGNNQSVTVGTSVTTAPSVTLKDANNNPASGVTVTFAVAAGGGTVTGGTQTTNASGVATVGSWTLGTTAGANTLTATASAPALAASPVLFTASALTGAATQIAILAGNNQSATVGTAVTTAPSVIVKDAFNNPVSGVAVTFAIATGGGSITGVAQTTIASGVATVGSWTLGTTAGANTLTAIAAALTGSPLTITATGTPGADKTITKTSTDPASVPAQSNVDSIRVKVADQFGNPKQGDVVTFTVTAGGGSVSPASVTTGADGQAAAQWTTGAGIGVVNTAAAARAGLATVITFTTTTTAATLTSVAINGPRTLVVDSLATVAMNAVGKDSSGNVIAGTALNFASRSPAATVANGNITGALRGSTFVVATAAQNANLKDSVLVTVSVPNAPVAITDLARLDIKGDTTFTVGIIVDMRTSGALLGASTVQVTWDPTVMTYVSDVDGSSGTAAIVNTTNTGSGSLTLTVASSTGFAGAVQLRKVTFTAAHTAGSTGNLALFVSELVAAASFTNLLPNTVAAIYPLIIR